MCCVMGAGAVVAGKGKQYVSAAQIKQAEALLTEMAKKPKLLTLQQTLEQLRPKILALMAKGYTHQDVVEALKLNGIQVALITLRQSLKEKPQEAAEESTHTKAMPQAVAKPDAVKSAAAIDAAIDVDAAIDAIVTATSDTNAAAPKRSMSSVLVECVARPAGGN